MLVSTFSLPAAAVLVVAVAAVVEAGTAAAASFLLLLDDVEDDAVMMRLETATCAMDLKSASEAAAAAVVLAVVALAAVAFLTVFTSVARGSGRPDLVSVLMGTYLTKLLLVVAVVVALLLLLLAAAVALAVFLLAPDTRRAAVFGFSTALRLGAGAAACDAKLQADTERFLVGLADDDEVTGVGAGAAASVVSGAAAVGLSRVVKSLKEVDGRKAPRPSSMAAAAAAI